MPIPGSLAFSRGEVAERLKAAVAKPNAAALPSSIFLANPVVSITSQIERLGCCRLKTVSFGTPQGQSEGQLAHPALIRICQILTISVMASTLDYEVTFR